MAVWHRTKRGDLGLRALGSGSCALAYLAIARLSAWQGPALSGGASALLLAATGFLGASAGSASMLLGAHLFDAVPVSMRWRPRSPPASRNGKPGNEGGADGSGG